MHSNLREWSWNFPNPIPLFRTVQNEEYSHNLKTHLNIIHLKERLFSTFIIGQLLKIKVLLFEIRLRI